VINVRKRCTPRWRVGLMKAIKYAVLGLVLSPFLFGPFMSNGFCAERYPDRPIQFIVSQVAGATMDVSARILATELEKVLGTTVVVVNKPGAATVLGTEAAVRAKKDGYTILITGTSAVTFAPITSPESVHFDPDKDLEFLGLYYYFPNTITVRADSPWKTFPEFVDYAKKNPGKIRISTTGIASGPHFVVEMVQSITGAQLTHVPFKGGESVVTALLGGHVEATCDNIQKIKPHVEAGKLRFLLITSKMADLPNVPTITEFGYKQNLLTSWFGIFAPAGIPEDAKKVLVPAIEKAVKAVKLKIDPMGNITDYRPPAEFKKIWADEYKQVQEIAGKIGLRK
jgi:tripartite-type tricarboxylate transporter receptor subunit TctC